MKRLDAYLRMFGRGEEADLVEAGTLLTALLRGIGLKTLMLAATPITNGENIPWR